MSIDSKRDSQEQLKDLEEQTKETKTFFQDSLRIDYQNSSKIFYSSENNCGDVKVNNYLCCQEGQNLFKITEIIYHNKIIRIEDRLQVFADSSNLGQICSFSQTKPEIDAKKLSRTNQKVRIFNKNASKDSKVSKKSKKNIVKNIIKLFLSWLQKKQSDRSGTHYEISLQELKKMIEMENLNNRLIQKIITSSEVNKAFLQFLDTGAEDEIKYSRIQDKQSHFEALSIYKNLFEKGLTNMGVMASNSEGSQQSQSPGELNRSSGDHNSSCSSSFNVCASKNKEAGIKTKMGPIKTNIIVVQSQMQDKIV